MLGHRTRDSTFKINLSVKTDTGYVCLSLQIRIRKISFRTSTINVKAMTHRPAVGLILQQKLKYRNLKYAVFQSKVNYHVLNISQICSNGPGTLERLSYFHI